METESTSSTVSATDQKPEATNNQTVFTVDDDNKWHSKASFVYGGQVISLSPSDPTERAQPAQEITERRKASWLQRSQQAVTNSFCKLKTSLKFEDESLERFYSIYSSKQRVLQFMSILIFNLSFAGILIVLTAYSYDNSKIPSLIMISTSIIISISILIAFRKNRIAGTTLVALSYLLWLLILLQIFVKLLGNSAKAGKFTGDMTVWLLLLCYFTYIVLPARRIYCLVLSVGVNVVHISVLLIHCELGSHCEKHYVQHTQVSRKSSVVLSQNRLNIGKF